MSLAEIEDRNDAENQGKYWDSFSLNVNKSSWNYHRT